MLSLPAYPSGEPTWYWTCREETSCHRCFLRVLYRTFCDVHLSVQLRLSAVGESSRGENFKILPHYPQCAGMPTMISCYDINKEIIVQEYPGWRDRKTHPTAWAGVHAEHTGKKGSFPKKSFHNISVSRTIYFPCVRVRRRKDETQVKKHFATETSLWGAGTPLNRFQNEANLLLRPH